MRGGKVSLTVGNRQVLASGVPKEERLWQGDKIRRTILIESTQTDMEVHNSPIFHTGLGILSRPAT
jgi:hypothetical protein